MQELNYSEDQAYRRINAMKLLKELPQIEVKLNTGALTLSNISVATQVFRKEVKIHGESRSSNEKLEMLVALENKSKREAEQILYRSYQLSRKMRCHSQARHLIILALKTGVRTGENLATQKRCVK